MILVLKNTDDIAKIKRFLAQRQVKKGFDAKKFVGKIPVDEDALVIQYRLRNEWN